MRRSLTLTHSALLVAVLAGCNVDFGYLIPAAVGQLDILARMVPVEQVLAEGPLTAGQRAKLELIQDVRAFAGSVVELDVGDNYSTFYDAGGEPVAHNISASRRDAFVPRVWSFPIVGVVPYLGYFELDQASARFDELEADGWDVFMYEIDAYSGLGFYPNPVLSPMLNRSDASLVDTVIHELLHATIWRPDDTTFNESLATFVGRTGAVQFYADRFPGEPERVLDATERFEDGDRFSDFALSLFDELDAYFRSDLPSQARIVGREAVYQAGRDRFTDQVLPRMHHPERYEWATQLPTNNAYMLGVRRYNLNLEVFAAVFAATGESWPDALAVYRVAAGADAPFAALQAWLDGDRRVPTVAKTDRARSVEDPTPVRLPGYCARCAARTLLARPPGQ